MAIQYAPKIVASDPYRIDNRAIINVPARPVAKDILDGPTVNPASGIRCSNDIYPWSTES